MPLGAQAVESLRSSTVLFLFSPCFALFLVAQSFLVSKPRRSIPLNPALTYAARVLVTSYTNLVKKVHL